MTDSLAPEPGQENRRPGRWTCRFHVWHRWRTHRYPDSDGYGARYQGVPRLRQAARRTARNRYCLTAGPIECRSLLQEVDRAIGQ